MKKLNLLFCLTILCISQVKSQALDTTNGYAFYDSTDYAFPQKWSKLFSQLDLSNITSGFFLDRAVNWISPAKHLTFVFVNSIS